MARQLIVGLVCVLVFLTWFAVDERGTTSSNTSPIGYSGQIQENRIALPTEGMERNAVASLEPTMASDFEHHQHTVVVAQTVEQEDRFTEASNETVDDEIEYLLSSEHWGNQEVADLLDYFDSDQQPSARAALEDFQRDLQASR